MSKSVLRQLVDKSGKTQKEIAADLGFSQQRFNYYVSGRSEPDATTLLQIADYFHVTVDYLLGRDILLGSQEFGTFEPISILFSFYKPLTVEMFSQITDIPFSVVEQLSVVSSPLEATSPKRNPLYKTLSDEQLQKIKAFFEIDTSSFKSDTEPSSVAWRYSVYRRLMNRSSEALPKDAFPINESHKIPLLGQIAAGIPIYAEQNIEGYIWTDRNHGSEYFGLRVRGDSMNAAKIDDGDIAIIQRCEIVEDGDIAVVLVDDDATIKRYHREGDMVILTPQSTNPENKTQFYSLKEHTIRILGRVVETRTTH